VEAKEIKERERERDRDNLRGSVYDLHLQGKAQRGTLFTIHKSYL
jgi:hypothetical protein